MPAPDRGGAIDSAEARVFLPVFRATVEALCGWTGAALEPLVRADRAAVRGGARFAAELHALAGHERLGPRQRADALRLLGNLEQLLREP
ncbi:MULTISPECIES: hypothetical protein [unclassified Streptomyces]|uniref:hypothetical protein n=1 Tax=unclassified Streptomyces TaxID=2593676 RepID=UPI0033C1BD51